MILTTIERVPDHEITEHYGMVVGSTVQTKHLFADICALFLKNLVGGEIRSYSDLLRESYEEATARMIEQAAEAGANAIINVRISNASIAINGVQAFVYGTAVKVAKR